MTSPKPWYWQVDGWIASDSRGSSPLSSEQHRPTKVVVKADGDTWREVEGPVSPQVSGPHLFITQRD